MNRPTAPDTSQVQELMTETLPRSYRITLCVLVFAAFLTQARFIPSIRTNVGPFEIIGLLLIVVFFLSPRTRRPLFFNAATRAALGILAVTVISQINIPENRRSAGLIHVAIQLFFVLFLVTLLNLMRQHQVSPKTVLQWVALALLIVGPWIIISGLATQDSVQEVGPFRNRAHMASYMLSAFWIALVYSQWPGLRAAQKILGYSGVAMTLYAVAVAGRRSVYLSLMVGLAGLAIGLLIGSQSKRWRLVVAGVFVAGIIYAMYSYGPRYLPQLQFFQNRVGMIDDRLGAALAISKEAAEEKGFFALQREGVRNAFLTHPVLGIGWGGFGRSHYSPTGHEVHSTPLRFLAETGLVGLALYIVFMIALVRSVWVGFLKMRKTPYGNAYLALAIGLTSLLISYAYNRHVSERTFWLLTAAIFSAELFAQRVQQATRAITAARERAELGGSEPEDSGPPSAPGADGAPSALGPTRPQPGPEPAAQPWATPTWTR